MILNRQRGVRVPIQDLNRFVSRMQRKFRVPSDAFSVCFVTNSQIGRWNRAFRGKKGATDVLSFPDDALDYLGDIAIAPAVAQKNARRLGRTLNHELRFLVLHGFLHLLGYDHETDNGEMEYLETMLSRVLRLN